MKRLATYLLCVLTLVLFHSCGVKRSSQPNVVLIIIDTLRADSLGCYGSSADPSPELDKLASTGVRFDDVIAPSSWTRPSMGSIMTGLYPRRLGLYRELGDTLPFEFKTLAEYLKEAGYATFGVTTNTNTNRVFQFDQGFDDYIDSLNKFPWQTDNADDTHNVLPANKVFELALDWAKGSRERPGFMQLTLMEVHEHREKLYNSMVRRDYRRFHRDHKHAAYLQSTHQVTDDIATFVEQMRVLKGWENTLFIVTSDHGEGLTDHPDVTHSHFHGYQIYESQVRVPWLIFSSTGSIPTKVLKETVSLVDLTPTLLELVGLELPQDLDGQSWASAVRGGQSPKPRAFEITESYFRECNKIAVFTKEGKYFEHRDQWPGVDAIEYYPRSMRENGSVNNQILYHVQTSDTYSAWLQTWEKSVIKRPPESNADAISEEELEQLRALGYVQ